VAESDAICLWFCRVCLRHIMDLGVSCEQDAVTTDLFWFRVFENTITLWGPRVRGQRQKTEDRRQKTEDRRQKTEDRWRRNLK